MYFKTCKYSPAYLLFPNTSALLYCTHPACGLELRITFLSLPLSAASGLSCPVSGPGREHRPRVPAPLLPVRASLPRRSAGEGHEHLFLPPPISMPSLSSCPGVGRSTFVVYVGPSGGSPSFCTHNKSWLLSSVPAPCRTSVDPFSLVHAHRSQHMVFLQCPVSVAQCHVPQPALSLCSLRCSPLPWGAS